MRRCVLYLGDLRLVCGQVLPLITLTNRLQGDIWHWASLFYHFDALYERYIKPRPDIQLDPNLPASLEAFPTRSVEAILRVTGIILENCSNKHHYDSYEVSNYHPGCCRANLLCQSSPIAVSPGSAERHSAGSWMLAAFALLALLTTRFVAASVQPVGCSCTFGGPCHPESAGGICAQDPHIKHPLPWGLSAQQPPPCHCFGLGRQGRGVTFPF